MAQQQHIRPELLTLPVHPQAYGVVWKAVDKKNNNLVALKKIFDAFQNATDAQVCWVQQEGVHGVVMQQQPVPTMPAHQSIYRTALTEACGVVLVSAAVQRTFREIMFLQDLNNHENIIR
jgi:serine/threonine protein kinase